MKKQRLSTFARLQKKILDELGIYADRFERTYAGYWQRRSGHFAWIAFTEDGGLTKSIGSIYTATELLKARRLDYDPKNGELFPGD